LLLLLEFGALRRRLTPPASHSDDGEDDDDDDEDDATIIVMVVTPTTILVAFIISGSYVPLSSWVPRTRQNEGQEEPRRETTAQAISTLVRRGQ
jgi:hypothetical protein